MPPIAFIPRQCIALPHFFLFRFFAPLGINDDIRAALYNLILICTDPVPPNDALFVSYKYLSVVPVRNN